MNSFIIIIDFTCSGADATLFIFKKDSNVLYLLVYVDDIILTGNNVTFIRDFITRLNKEFLIIDLGKLNYFLGVEVSYHEIMATAHLLC